MKYVAVLLLLLAGCTTYQEPAPVEGPGGAPVPPPSPSSTIRQENVAIAGLMDSARKDASSGKLGSAAATLERALRIEPRNPRLWHELALVRLRQTDYAQAESLAARSNTYAGADSELRAANQKVISDARAQRR
jgi:Flp pilus assembly protein TadD